MEEIAGVAGFVFITTVIVPLVEGQPPVILLTVTEYKPAFSIVVLGMIGSSRVELKPLGPVQE